MERNLKGQSYEHKTTTYEKTGFQRKTKFNGDGQRHFSNSGKAAESASVAGEGRATGLRDLDLDGKETGARPAELVRGRMAVAADLTRIRRAKIVVQMAMEVERF
jgi:hypothetical protein